MTFSFVGVALYGASRADIPRLQLGAGARGAESAGFAQGGVFSRDAELTGVGRAGSLTGGPPLPCPAAKRWGKPGGSKRYGFSC